MMVSFKLGRIGYPLRQFGFYLTNYVVGVYSRLYDPHIGRLDLIYTTTVYIYKASCLSTHIVCICCGCEFVWNHCRIDNIEMAI